ncbi:MAG: DUF2752 domain-containing protein [Actinobacteria bacterium]|nr:DUF2752 domain-containing protein [Actinomycetota bacterium]
MEHVAPIPVADAGRWSGRWGVVAAGCVLAGSATLVALVDPAAEGSRFPGCTFHQLTGLWCPGCGLTRGVHHLLRGDLAGAVGSNVFTPLVVIAVMAGWAGWARRAFGWTTARPRWRDRSARAQRWAGVGLIGAMVVYAVLRNVPGGTFSALAP